MSNKKLEDESVQRYMKLALALNELDRQIM